MNTPEKRTIQTGGERLQKVLARAGISSRRGAEELIQNGRVRVDGRVVAELGVRVDPRARIEVDGKRIAAEPFVYIVLNKPRAVMCTMSDPEGRPTIADLVRGVGARVVPVGRLDFHTSGALLLTNDGDFASVLTHPRFHVPKVYVAKVKGVLDERALDKLRESIDIDGVPTRPADVRLLRHEGDKTWLRVILQEGKNRQVRRIGEAAGYPVMRLVREQHAGISSEGLRPGSWRPLTADELADLKKAYGVPKRVRTPEVPEVRGRQRPEPRPAKAGRPGRAERAAKAGRAEARPSKPGWAEGRPSKPGRAEARPSKPGWAEGRPSKPGRAEARPSKPGRAEARVAKPRPTERGRDERRPSAAGERAFSRRRGT